ncbi:MAG: hypothetical protein WAO27_01835, partial [Limnochordia bacterium]
ACGRPSYFSCPVSGSGVPQDLQQIEGFYNSPLGLFQVQLTEDKSGIVIAVFDGIGYTPYITAAYRAYGRFYTPSGTSYPFSEGELGSVILGHPDSSDAGYVIFEKLMPEAEVDDPAFAGRTWLLRNLSRHDLLPWMARTIALPELPGYVVLFDGTYYTPLALSDPSSTKMAFPLYPRPVRDVCAGRAGRDAALQSRLCVQGRG